jgi:hypothetical protein
MNTTQEPKYEIVDNILVNRQSGEPLPPDEPLFILRGRDVDAANAIAFYFRTITNDEHRRAVGIRLDQFNAFALANPERMKKADTIITDDWKDALAASAKAAPTSP